MEQLDFVFFNTLYEQQNNSWLFEECLKHVHGDDGLVSKHQNQPQNARILAGSMLSSRSNGDDRPVFNGNRVFQQEVTQEGLYRLFLTLYPKIQIKLIFDLYIRLTSSTAMLDLICDRDNNRKQ